MIEPDNINHLIRKAISDDKGLKELYAKIADIYGLTIPKIIINYDGEVEVKWIDETNHHILSEIEILINHRIEQIKSYYSKKYISS